SRGPAARQDEAARTDAARIEDLHSLAPIGHVGDRKAAVDRDVKRTRLDQPAVLRADLDELSGDVAGGIDAEYRVAAAIEDVVIADGGLFEPDRLAEQARDVRGQRVRGLEHLDG